MSEASTPALTLVQLDPRGEDRDALIAFLQGSAWPFHVGVRPSEDEISRAIDAGRFSEPEEQALWIEHPEHGRVGLAVLEDLEDPTPLLDLRLDERFRGQGLGAPALRAVTAHLFAMRPDITRFEGNTREDNVAMRRTFARCGWVQEAHYREAWPIEGGDPVGSVAYAMLRRDWESGTATPAPPLESEAPPAAPLAGLDEKIQRYYSDGHEQKRLVDRSASGITEVQRVRAQLAGIPEGSRVLDVGGATGIHAAWLAGLGHVVTMIDPVPKQVEIAARQGTFIAAVGDARNLAFDDDSFDVVLLFGPLYHLSAPDDRSTALGEALRVLRPGGILFASAVTRLSSVMDSLLDSGGSAVSEEVVEILRTGDWVNPGDGYPGGHFHTADELSEELRRAGFSEISVRGLEMPSMAWEVYPADEQLADACRHVLERMDELDPQARRARLIADLSPHLLARAIAPSAPRRA